jgi:hypothetical protein
MTMIGLDDGDKVFATANDGNNHMNKVANDGVDVGDRKMTGGIMLDGDNDNNVNDKVMNNYSNNSDS